MNEVAKSKIAAGLLGIFLGQFGVHNFYLGYKRNALIQVIVSGSCWLVYILCMFLGFLTAMFGIGIIFFLLAMLVCVGPTGMGIWGLIEGIFILTGKINTDGKGNPLAN